MYPNSLIEVFIPKNKIRLYFNKLNYDRKYILLNDSSLLIISKDYLSIQ